MLSPRTSRAINGDDADWYPHAGRIRHGRRASDANTDASSRLLAKAASNKVDSAPAYLRELPGAELHILEGGIEHSKPRPRSLSS